MAILLANLVSFIDPRTRVPINGLQQDKFNDGTGDYIEVQYHDGREWSWCAFPASSVESVSDPVEHADMLLLMSFDPPPPKPRP